MSPSRTSSNEPGNDIPRLDFERMSISSRVKSTKQPVGRVPSAESRGVPPSQLRPSTQALREEALATMSLHQLKQRLVGNGAERQMKDIERSRHIPRDPKRPKYVALLESMRGGKKSKK